MASLTLGSMNFPSGPSVNSPETIEALAGRMRRQGIAPELEVFDVGMANVIHYYRKQCILTDPTHPAPQVDPAKDFGLLRTPRTCAAAVRGAGLLEVWRDVRDLQSQELHT